MCTRTHTRTGVYTHCLCQISRWSYYFCAKETLAQYLQPSPDYRRNVLVYSVDHTPPCMHTIHHSFSVLLQSRPVCRQVISGPAFVLLFRRVWVKHCHARQSTHVLFVHRTQLTGCYSLQFLPVWFQSVWLSCSSHVYILYPLIDFYWANWCPDMCPRPALMRYEIPQLHARSQRRKISEGGGGGGGGGQKINWARL